MGPQTPLGLTFNRPSKATAIGRQVRLGSGSGNNSNCPSNRAIIIGLGFVYLTGAGHGWINRAKPLAHRAARRSVMVDDFQPAGRGSGNTGMMPDISV